MNHMITLELFDFFLYIWIIPLFIYPALKVITNRRRVKKQIYIRDLNHHSHSIKNSYFLLKLRCPTVWRLLLVEPTQLPKSDSYLLVNTFYLNLVELFACIQNSFYYEFQLVYPSPSLPLRAILHRVSFPNSQISSKTCLISLACMISLQPSYQTPSPHPSTHPHPHTKLIFLLRESF